MDYYITISRQYGSLGTDIGKIIASNYNINCYTKEIIENEAKKIDLNENIFNVSNPSNSFVNGLVKDEFSSINLKKSFSNMHKAHKDFLIESEAILSLAKNGPCVFIGRSADFILEKYNPIKIFIFSKLDIRAKRISDILNMPFQEAKNKIIEIDKKRKQYYNFYTNKKWGITSSYDLCLNTSELTYNEGAKIIINYLNTIDKHDEQKF